MSLSTAFRVPPRPASAPMAANNAVHPPRRSATSSAPPNPKFEVPFGTTPPRPDPGFGSMGPATLGKSSSESSFSSRNYPGATGGSSNGGGDDSPSRRRRSTASNRSGSSGSPSVLTSPLRSASQTSMTAQGDGSIPDQLADMIVGAAEARQWRSPRITPKMAAARTSPSTNSRPGESVLPPKVPSPALRGISNSPLAVGSNSASGSAAMPIPSMHAGREAANSAATARRATTGNIMSSSAPPNQVLGRAALAPPAGGSRKSSRRSRSRSRSGSRRRRGYRSVSSSRSRGSRASILSGSSSGYSSYDSDSEGSGSDLEMLSPRSRHRPLENGFNDFCVANIRLAEDGRREIDFAAQDMPGLLALREQYADVKPLAGARIVGSLHMTIETAVLIEVLIELGAQVRWCSCNIYSTQDHAAAALAKGGVPVFAWKGESEDEFWWCMHRCFNEPGWIPNMIVDDGGDATMMLHQDYPKFVPHIKGITEETSTGVHRLYQLAREHRLRLPAININDSVTKSKFDNLYGCRESVTDAIKRATGMMMSGKIAIVAGYGDVGKGCAAALRAAGMVVGVTEIDPICALQACMEGFRVYTMAEAAEIGDLFVTATGSRGVIRREHMEKMRDHAVLCNMGHFDAEIDVASLRGLPIDHMRPQVDRVTLPSGNRIVILAEGRLVNLSCGAGHSSFVMSITFTNQILAQMELYRARVGQYKAGVYLLPRHLDEEVARLHLPRFQAHLDEMTQEQADYLGIELGSSIKSDGYRY